MQGKGSESSIHPANEIRVSSLEVMHSENNKTYIPETFLHK